MPEFIKKTIQDHVARIVIDRPEVHNAFNDVVIAELTRAFENMGERDDVRVVVLASEGLSFSAGADMHWMKSMVDYTFEENVADSTKMAQMLRTIRECPKVTIARVHGATLGGGVGLTAACDLAVALKDAVFALTEVKLGILPAVISPYVQEKIGAGQIRRYALTAERFDAIEARRIGIISEIADSIEQLDEKIDFFTKMICKTGPQAIVACKQILREIQPVNWESATDVTVRLISERRVSDEGQDGLRAFLEKRSAKWIEDQ